MKLLTRDLLVQLESLQILSRRKRASHLRGEKPGSRKGASIEFSDYREYMHGDDIRSIDWNVYARTERLFLKLFFEEQSKPVYFIVDASRSMAFGDPTKFDYALSLASALSYVCLKKYDQPHLLILQADSIRKVNFSSLRSFFATADQLAKVEPAGETFLGSSLRKIAFSRYKQGIYFVLSDFFSPDGFDGMKLLASAGNEVNCLQILSEDELHPTLRGDLRLIDSETSGLSDVSISPQILRKYAARLDALQAEIKSACAVSSCEYYAISTSTPLASLLLKNLRQIGIVA